MQKGLPNLINHLIESDRNSLISFYLFLKHPPLFGIDLCLVLFATLTLFFSFFHLEYTTPSSTSRLLVIG